MQKYTYYFLLVIVQDIQSYIYPCYDLSAGTFLRQLYHLSLQYNLPRTLVSDNQSTFKKASEYLKRMCEDADVQSFLGEKGIEWKFSAPYSQRTLGIAERIVGLVKKSLYLTLNSKKIPAQELDTLILEIMNTLNMRPLSYLSSEDVPLEDNVLTPQKLLFGRSTSKFNFLTSFVACG